MNNAKLTPGILAIGVALATLAGPLYLMHDITSLQIMDQSYWLDIAAATVRSFAVAGTTAISIVGTALGLPALFERWRPAAPPESE